MTCPGNIETSYDTYNCLKTLRIACICYNMYRRLLFYIWSGEGAWTMELDNVWCSVEYGHDWTASISSQLECQSLCSKTPYCVGISYSYREGMTHSCFFCKNDVLETNSYGFGFYRMPGKILSLSNTKYTLQVWI